MGAKASLDQQLVLPRIAVNKVGNSQPLLNLRGPYGREPSNESREGSGLARIPSSHSRKYLMPNDILRNVRSSHQSLDPPIALPVGYGQHSRAISNHRNDLAYKRPLLCSR